MVRKAPGAVWGIGVTVVLAAIVVVVALAVIGAFEVDQTVRTPDGDASPSTYDVDRLPDPPDFPPPPAIQRPPIPGTVR